MIIPNRFSGPTFAGLSIGLLGGSFNPAHAGHLKASLAAMKRLGLDQVWWLVTPQNPFKSTHGMLPLAERVSRARTLMGRHPRLVVTDLEFALGTRRTFDTLRALRRRMPRTRFVWLAGADTWQAMGTWFRGDAIPTLIPLAVLRRPGSRTGRSVGRLGTRFVQGFGRLAEARGLARRSPPAWLVLDNPRVDLSATRVRNADLGQATKNMPGLRGIEAP